MGHTRENSREKNRGNERQTIFHEVVYCQTNLDILEDVCEPFN